MRKLVTIRMVDAISPIEGADKIELARMNEGLLRSTLERTKVLLKSCETALEQRDAQLTEARRLLDDARALVRDSCPFVPQWATVLQKRYASFLADSPAPVPPAASTKTHQWEDDHCIKCGDSDWYAGPICSECKVVQPAAVPEAVAKDAAAILVQALEEIAWQRPLGVRPSKSGEAMERAAIIALHKYNALLSAADTEVKK